jgi:hypothetical protein
MIEVDPEYNLPEAREELGKVENWVHFNEYILKGGRTSYYIPKHLDEAAAETLKGELAEKDPTVDRLKGIPEDKRSRGHHVSRRSRSGRSVHHSELWRKTAVQPAG